MLKNVSEKQIIVTRLNEIDAAKLLNRAMPRTIEHDDLTAELASLLAEHTHNLTTLDVVAQHPTLLALHGHPRAIRELASMTGDFSRPHKYLKDLLNYAKTLYTKEILATAVSCHTI